MITKHESILNNEPLAAHLRRFLEHMVCKYHLSVEDGWRFGIQMQNKGAAGPYFELDIQSNRGGGNYAGVKMATLCAYPELCATGLETPEEFSARIMQHFTNGNYPADIRPIFQKAARKVKKLDYLEQMPKEIAELLRRYNLTSYKGGIRIPYENESSHNGNTTTHRGEIRLVFSGAEEWQDLFLCFCILAHLQQVLLQLWPQDQVWYNIRALMANPQTLMFCKHLNIQEAPYHGAT